MATIVNQFPLARATVTTPNRASALWVNWIPPFKTSDDCRAHISHTNRVSQGHVAIHVVAPEASWRSMQAFALAFALAAEARPAEGQGCCKIKRFKTVASSSRRSWSAIMVGSPLPLDCSNISQPQQAQSRFSVCAVVRYCLGWTWRRKLAVA
jgi:hypothetical protein